MKEFSLRVEGRERRSYLIWVSIVSILGVHCLYLSFRGRFPVGDQSALQTAAFLVLASWQLFLPLYKLVVSKVIRLDGDQLFFAHSILNRMSRMHVVDTVLEDGVSFLLYSQNRVMTVSKDSSPELLRMELKSFVEDPY
ncbi:MAG: hypothetical protein P1U87_11040 [Verrucomicrobiales bacterium]|nr:hypothetical protein [Verrucomicrobiales bacterium]